MTARKNKNRQRVQVQHLPVLQPDAAGIDVGSAEHWVAVGPDRDEQPVRRFAAFTADLVRLADWLTQCGIKTVAMEATGVYWIPLFELLESRGFEVFLVDPRQTHNVKGRPKTDRLDCQWIQRLHACGLLAGSFRPSDQIVVLRGYLRQKQMLVRYAAQHVQHLQKALEQMNVKLTEVVSDITGVTGLSILKAILQGERDPVQLAKLRNVHCKASEAGIAQALAGNWRQEHLFELKQALALWEFYRQQIEACDHEIERYLGTLPDQSADKPRLEPKPRQRKRGANEPAYDARGLVYRVSGVDLTAIEGIDQTTALVLIAEIGPDLSRFPSRRHFCAWLGLCPQHKISGGKVQSRRVRPGVSRAARALRLSAWALHRSKSALGAYCRKMKARLGAAKGIVATAHKLARLVYALLTQGQEYVSQAMEEYEQAYKLRKVKGLARQAEELGYRLEPAQP
ncbi:MAG TPA: IS110 family transposase [Gemmataceae bacterium]|nr:IS110 family transposase [Gemmataceae bacterium]